MRVSGLTHPTSSVTRMTFVILTRSCQIRTSNLTRMSVAQTRNLRTFLSAMCGQINGQTLKFGICTSQSLGSPSKQLIRTKRRNGLLGFKTTIVTSKNFVCSSSILRSGKSDIDSDTSSKEDSVIDGTYVEESNTTENLSEEDRQRKLAELKQRFKILLDDAGSQKVAPDEFDFGDFPQEKSEITEEEQKKKLKINPADKSVLLFPGQGAQFVGMGKQLLDYPVVKDMYEVASEILGYDLLALCIEGPRESLDRTVHCQPAVLVTSLAAVEKLKNENIKVRWNKSVLSYTLP